MSKLVAFVMCVAMLSLAACGNSEVTTTAPETDPPHVHIYSSRVTQPTVDKRGFVEMVCECGDIESSEYFGISEIDEESLVLFIGNSYTYYNDMHQIFQKIAKGQGINVEVYSITKGGYALLQFADEKDPYGKMIDTYLGAKEVDYIFIQEQSERPAKDPKQFYDGVRAISERLASEEADILLYQTWGRKEPHSTLTSNGWTHEEMAYRLAASYEAIAEEMGYELSPVGSAFLDVYKNHPEINLYHSDNTHPSPAGSYLIALCHYATLYGLSPVGVEYNMNLSDDVVSVLQNAAHNAVFGDSIVPPEYKVSSVK